MKLAGKYHLAAIACLAALVLSSAQTARADQDALTGTWVYATQGLRIEMVFGPGNQCSVVATNDQQKSSSFTGTYKASDEELVITPSDSSAVVYVMKLKGDAMTLSGGDFAEGKSVLFNRRSAAAADHPTGKLVLPRKADDAGDGKADGKTDDGGKTDPKPAGDLPGGAWDTKSLEAAFTVLKTKYDPNASQVTWLLVKNTDNFSAYLVSFYDEDDVKLGAAAVQFEPNLFSIAKGERTRGTVTLPREVDMKKVTKVVVVKQ